MMLIMILIIMKIMIFFFGYPYISMVLHPAVKQPVTLERFDHGEALWVVRG